MSTTAVQCDPGFHVTLKILPPSLNPPADPTRLWMNLACASEDNIFCF